MPVEVSPATMPPKRTIETFYETAAEEGEVGEGGAVKNIGGGADKNGVSNFIFNPLLHFLFRSAAAEVYSRTSVTSV